MQFDSLVLLLSRFCGFFFFIFAAGFAFALSNFAHYYVVIFNAPLSDRDVCDGLRFPGNLDISSLTPRGLIVPLVCGFRRRYNFLAWRELFANLYDLYEPKSLNLAFLFWEEYNHFKRFYRVYRLDRFSSNFAKTFRSNDKWKYVDKFWY